MQECPSLSKNRIRKKWREVYMMMAQGFSILLLIFYMVLIFGCMAAVVFFILAAWRVMKAHESIAESMKVIAEVQSAKTAGRAAEGGKNRLV
jgi:cell division septal protein FtsQ